MPSATRRCGRLVQEVGCAAACSSILQGSILRRHLRGAGRWPHALNGPAAALAARGEGGGVGGGGACQPFKDCRTAYHIDRMHRSCGD
jgi:hypothetical protein